MGTIQEVSPTAEVEPIQEVSPTAEVETLLFNWGYANA